MSSAGAAAGASAAAAAGAVIQAINASGVIVRVETQAFMTIVERQEEPLVVYAMGGVFRKYHQYLCSYKGLAFYCKSVTPLRLPPGREVVLARSIWIPS